MIDESRPAAPRRRVTRAEQRAATRSAIVEATVQCLVDEGYGALTTRRVAERAEVAQSTLMHHFPTREALILEAVTLVALRLADRALDTIDPDGLRTPEGREAVLDEAWREFTSAQALAAAQLWSAVWTEPDLAATLRELEERIGAIILTTVAAVFSQADADDELDAMVHAAVALIRGLVMAIPIWGRAAIDARWAAIKPLLLRAFEPVLDRPGTGGD
ncbi:MAG: TetR/AcrR family transcriptional regulator [Solirubrobacteraceae bacterium]